MEKCPGLYCGRIYFEANNTFSSCGSCPRGFRRNDSSICDPCEGSPSTYDWMYLGFMALMPLVLHWFFIDISYKERTFGKSQLILHCSAFLEVVVAAALTMFMFGEGWSFDLKSCPIERLSDWYTLFHNPNAPMPPPQYIKKLHCTQEAVYPLQTIVLAFYFICLLMMMMVRPFLNVKVGRGKSALYSALYFLPILSVIHAVGSGLIYYSFPYLSIIISMISNAAHFSFKFNQSMISLFKTSVTELKNAVIILGHFLLLAYGIISLHHHYALLTFVPLPAIFYIITVKFTDPSEFREKSSLDRSNRPFDD